MSKMKVWLNIRKALPLIILIMTLSAVILIIKVRSEHITKDDKKDDERKRSLHALQKFNTSLLDPIEYSQWEMAVKGWENDYIDGKPILIRAVLVKMDVLVLALFLSDEDKDIFGVGIKEKHYGSDRESEIIEEYPIYWAGFVADMPDIQCIPVKLRAKGDRKNEADWTDFQNMNKFVPEMMPDIYISRPASKEVEVYAWIYDKSGNKSQEMLVKDMLK